MKKMSKTIVFFGSGPVAATSLELLAQDFEIEAVITKPQPLHHKEAFPVLELANRLGLRVFTPTSRQELSDLFSTKPVSSQVGVVIDYGFIINKDVIDYFPLGIVNSHFSLLPEWRGADPISFTILSGQKETGVSAMLIVEKLDEGPLLGQKSFKIPDNATTPSLTLELIRISNELLIEVLPLYITGTFKPYSQDLSKPVTYSRKLIKDDGIIDWEKSADQIEREIRAFAEWPKSRSTIGGKEVIITQAHVIPSNDPGAKPGNVQVAEYKLTVECGVGYLCIDRLKPAGKNEMSAAEFIRGYGNRLS